MTENVLEITMVMKILSQCQTVRSLLIFLVLSTSISATVSGRGRSFVSGSQRERRPPDTPRDPNTRNWGVAGFRVW